MICFWHILQVHDKQWMAIAVNQDDTEGERIIFQTIKDALLFTMERNRKTLARSRASGFPKAAYALDEAALMRDMISKCKIFGVPDVPPDGFEWEIALVPEDVEMTLRFVLRKIQ